MTRFHIIFWFFKTYYSRTFLTFYRAFSTFYIIFFLVWFTLILPFFFFTNYTLNFLDTIQWLNWDYFEFMTFCIYIYVYSHTIIPCFFLTYYTVTFSSYTMTLCEILYDTFLWITCLYYINKSCVHVVSLQVDTGLWLSAFQMDQTVSPSSVETSSNLPWCSTSSRLVKNLSRQQEGFVAASSLQRILVDSVRGHTSRRWMMKRQKEQVEPQLISHPLLTPR